MKKIILLSLLLAFFSVSVFNQTGTKDEITNLNQEILTLYQAGKLNEAIQVSNKLVKIAKKSDSLEKVDLAILISTSARLKKEQFQKLRQKLLSQRMEREEILETNNEMNNLAIEADEDFQDALKIFEKSNSVSQQSAFAKGQYAWLLFNHPGKLKQDINPNPYKPERWEKAEKLYLEALSSYEQLLGKDSNLGILTIFDLAEFYLNWSKFEKSIPFYEKYIQAVEKKYGKDKVSLVPALRSLSEIMITINRKDKAQELNQRILSISGKKMKFDDAIFDLGLRKKKSAEKKTIIIETIRPEDLTSGYETYNNSLAILRGGRRGEPEARYNFDQSLSFGLRNNKMWVEILVDEKGKVIEAKPIPNDEDVKSDDKLLNEAKKEVSGWEFEPFELNGQKRKMRGFVLFVSSEVG